MWQAQKLITKLEIRRAVNATVGVAAQRQILGKVTKQKQNKEEKEQQLQNMVQQMRENSYEAKCCKLHSGSKSKTNWDAKTRNKQKNPSHKFDRNRVYIENLESSA